MSRFQPGLYVFRPADAPEGYNLTTAGPTTLPLPPPDISISVNRVNQFWRVISSVDNTFNVFAGSGKPTDFKWIDKFDALFASVITLKPDDFRIESAGNGLWVIGIPAQNLLLTYDPEAFPQLTFRPANGSIAQRFEAIRIDRSDS